VDKAHGNEIGRGGAETGRTVGGEQIPATLVAGEGRILLLPVDKENSGILWIFVQAVGTSQAGKRPGMAAICALEVTLPVVPKDC